MKSRDNRVLQAISEGVTRLAPLEKYTCLDHKQLLASLRRLRKSKQVIKEKGVYKLVDNNA